MQNDCGVINHNFEPCALKKTMQQRQRQRRSNEETKYIETVVVLDQSILKTHQFDIDTTQYRAFEIFNFVDSIYKGLGTRVAVVNMVVWNIFNIAMVSVKSYRTLVSFERYIRYVLKMRLTFDYAQLLSIK